MEKDYKIISEPSEEDLRPTQEEQAEIDELQAWVGNGLKSDWPIPYCIKN